MKVEINAMGVIKQMRVLNKFNFQKKSNNCFKIELKYQMTYNKLLISTPR